MYISCTHNPVGAITLFANGRSSDSVLGNATFPLITMVLNFHAVAFITLPLNKDLQHRAMLQILTAFPS